ncbi:MAG: tRNA (N(6)-L-threonylcarbamoyladenosine(37)-C(2))-methylthiotransferase [Candidatus Thermoplasmatota archaeon]|nr:tRNA (N(6)-L-threonylcarbamoyladenosine(37)-C(2))-methylthiotransferase [Candidatus Thermoplasmatota archaeon]MBU1941066.1 tRNA (N(6)-L-threonylcarbamoyladenosine(37)-C(2))-methylthiotransferase [Candidatus Thermoplasmatota archaeon]
MHVYLETYGCTANKSDHCTIEGILRYHNHTIVKDPPQADAIILLTCIVIDTTEQRMLSRIQNLNKYQKIFIIAGCMPSVYTTKIHDVAPNALLLPPQQITQVNNLLTGKKDTISTSIPPPKYYNDIIAPISIAEGCLLSCSYCITHLARGTLKSRSPEDILTDITQALTQECKEIQLTAQDTAAYGMDTPSQTLGTLLKTATKIDGDYHLRVGMMNPCSLQKNLNSIIDGYHSPHIYKFLHLPLQSGDDLILEKMKRGYTTELYRTLLTTFKKTYLDITLSTDIIVGFPTETNEQFNHTIDFLSKINPDIINITRFSARPRTPAKKMTGRLPTKLVKERSRTLTHHCIDLTTKKNKTHIETLYPVMITKKIDKNHVLGRTPSYKPVIIPHNLKLGSHHTVNIIEADAIHLFGNLI